MEFCLRDWWTQVWCGLIRGFVWALAALYLWVCACGLLYKLVELEMILYGWAALVIPPGLAWIFVTLRKDGFRTGFCFWIGMKLGTIYALFVLVVAASWVGYVLTPMVLVAVVHKEKRLLFRERVSANYLWQ